MDYYEPTYEISSVFWGAMIFLALFVCCFLAWKTIGRVNNRKRFDAVAVEEGHPKHPDEPWDPAISSPSDGHNFGVSYYRYGEYPGLRGMTGREQEELFSTYAPRRVRKAMRRRRKAREQAQKKQSE